MKFNEDKKVYVAYIALCFFWGTTYLAIRIGVTHFPPAFFAGIRFAIAGLIMLMYAWYRGFSIPTKFKSLIRLSIIGLFLLVGANGTVVWAEQWVHSGIASLVVATVPLFMALIETILPNTKGIGLKGWIGLIIGFIGVVFLVYSNLNTESINFIGVGALLFASLMWSIGSLYSKSIEIEGSIFSKIGIQMLAGGIVLLLIGFINNEFKQIHFTVSGLFSLLYLIFFGSIVGYGSYIYVLQKWPAAKAGTYAYVNPLVAVILGWLILDENMSFSILFSAFIILTGVFLVQTSRPIAKNKVDKVVGAK